MRVNAYVSILIRFFWRQHTKIDSIHRSYDHSEFIIVVLIYCILRICWCIYIETKSCFLKLYEQRCDQME